MKPNKPNYELPKIGDNVLTPRGNLGRVVSLSSLGNNAQVQVNNNGVIYEITIPRRELKVVVQL